MDTPTSAVALMSLISMCGTSSSSSEEPTPSGWTCSEYQIMLDVEVSLAEECNVDSECQQVLSGTGVGCATDDLIANTSYNTNYFYDLYDEAVGYGCSIDFDTSGECDPDAEPACNGGTCGWY